MAGQTIKLQTNIPVTGVVEYVDYIQSKMSGPDGRPYSDQIAVRGKFDCGEGRVYLPLSIEADFQMLGIVGPKQQNGNYPLKATGTRIKLLRTEDGNRKITTVEVLSAGVAPTSQPQYNAAPPQQSLYPPAQTSGYASFTAQPQKSNAERWSEMTLCMKNCLLSAADIWTQAGGNIEKNCVEIQACSSTLFIECQKSGVKPEKLPAEPAF